MGKEGGAVTLDERRAEVARLREEWLGVPEWDWPRGIAAADAYNEARERLAEEEQKAKEMADAQR